MEEPVGRDEREAEWEAAAAEVDAAYELHDSYSAEHKLLLAQHAARAHALLAALAPASARERAQIALLRGKLLDSSPAYSAEAEALLTRAVKLEPRSIDAWNALAECVWKGGQLELARACLDEALRVRATCGSLCQLSMLLRAMSGSASDGADVPLVLDSLRFAKEAVALDVECGRAWFVLGSACLAAFFAATREVHDLRSALKAYHRAASAARRPQEGCADLHYNRAIVLQYLLEYGQACCAFASAHRLAPELGAGAHRAALLAFARKCAEAVAARGHLPRKRLQLSLIHI